MERRAIQIARLRLGLLSNNRALIHSPEYFADRVQQCLLTAYHKVEDIAWDGLDVRWTIFDDPAVPASIHVEGDRIVAAGDFTGLEARNPDRRYGLFGNLGFLYRYVIRGLEEFHDTFTFHASAMRDEATGELWLIPGSAGAGKTVFLLSGLERGWTIFSTEMTHLRLTEHGFEWSKGSLLDNIRIGNLLHDFPETPRRLGLDLPAAPDPWGTKIAIDFAPVQTGPGVLVDPPLRIVHPKVESGRAAALVSDIRPATKLARLLFDNATEKHGVPFILYDGLVVAALDAPRFQAARWRAMETLVRKADIRSAKATLCGARNCMEGL
jgi:hypothetical protein